MGIVPDTPLSRRFRDLAGGLNQTVARLADRVELMVAGVPMTVLRRHKPPSPPRRSWLSPPIQSGQDQYVAALAG